MRAERGRDDDASLRVDFALVRAADVETEEAAGLLVLRLAAELPLDLLEIGDRKSPRALGESGDDQAVGASRRQRLAKARGDRQAALGIDRVFELTPKHLLNPPQLAGSTWV